MMRAPQPMTRYKLSDIRALSLEGGKIAATKIPTVATTHTNVSNQTDHAGLSGNKITRNGVSAYKSEKEKQMIGHACKNTRKTAFKLKP